MKIYKKIIAVLVFALVLVSTFLVFIPSVSATVVNGTSYDWKVIQGQLSLSEYPSGSFSQSCYITVGCDDWQLSGKGSFGYDVSAASFYVQIDKYAGSNGSWIIKLDSSKYWKYRDGLNDYGTMQSTWHSMKTEPKDIYVTFGGIDLNDTWWLTKTLTYSPTETYTITFTGDGVTTFTKQVAQMENFTFPDYTRTGYKLKRWQVAGSSIWYNVGDTIPAYGNETFIAEWERVSPYTLTFTGEGVTTFTEQVEIGESFTFPDYTRTGYKLKRWQVAGSSIWYDVGDTIPAYGNETFIAEWERVSPYTLTFTGEGVTTFTEQVEIGESFTFPNYTRKGYDLERWKVKDVDIFYDVGENVTPLSDVTFEAVWKAKTATFQGDGFEPFELPCELDGTITMPTLPEGTTREGYIFDGWSDGAYIYKTGMTYNCEEKNNYTFTAVWKEVAGVGSDGTDDDDINFITDFFFDTYDKTKELVFPYLTEVEIPFLNCTLADIVTTIFYAIIAWVVILLISKVIGALK